VRSVTPNLGADTGIAHCQESVTVRKVGVAPSVTRLSVIIAFMVTVCLLGCAGVILDGLGTGVQNVFPTLGVLMESVRNLTSATVLLGGQATSVINLRLISMGRVRERECACLLDHSSAWEGARTGACTLVLAS